MSIAQPGRLLIAIAAIVILATVVAAVMVMESPQIQRERRIDARRVADLTQIEDAIDRYYQEHGVLPQDLATLAAKPGQRLSVVDPEHGRGYRYEIDGARIDGAGINGASINGAGVNGAGINGAGINKTRMDGARAYRLCAEFTTDTATQRVDWDDPQWAHGAGMTCFRRIAERPGVKR